MTANVRFDYFTAARGAFIKSERENITFRNLDELETLIKIDANIRAKKYGDEVIGHVMEVCQVLELLYPIFIGLVLLLIVVCSIFTEGR